MTTLYFMTVAQTGESSPAYLHFHSSNPRLEKSQRHFPQLERSAIHNHPNEDNSYVAQKYGEA